MLPLVRIGVHEPGVRELRDARLHRHLRHHQPFFRGQIGDVFPLDPLRGEHARGTGLAGKRRVPLRRAHEPQPVVPLVELVHVPSFVDVVELLEDALADFVGDVAQVRLAAPRLLQRGEAQRPDGPVQRDLPHDVRTLHLHGDDVAAPKRRLVHLTERRRRDGRSAEFSEERFYKRIGARLLRRVLRRERPVERKVLRDRAPRDFVRKRRVLHLQALERVRGFVADQIGALRQRLADLHENRP